MRAIATPGYGCLAECLFKMCVGNRIGLDVDPSFAQDLFTPAYGSFVIEVAQGCQVPGAQLLGTTTQAYQLAIDGQTLDLSSLQEVWEAKLEPVMPYRKAGQAVDAITYTDGKPTHAVLHRARPRVIIPVFPGNNCEYDSARAFTAAGADAHVLVINNLTPEAVAESCQELCDQIGQSQIVMIPGGSPAAMSLMAVRNLSRRSSAPPRLPKRCATCCRIATV